MPQGYPRWAGDGEEACRASAACSKTTKCQDLAPFPEAGGAAFRSLGNPAAKGNGCPGLPDETFPNLCTATNYTEKNGLKRCT